MNDPRPVSVNSSTPLAISDTEDEVGVIIRDQISAAVYEHTRKGSACVEVKSLNLCTSQGTRTHVVTVRVGWSSARLARESYGGISYRSDHELLEHARADQALGRMALETDLRAWSMSQTGFTTALPSSSQFKAHFNEAHCNTDCDVPGCIDGEVTCPDCRGSLRMRCRASCDHGKIMCYACTGTGTVSRYCTACVGGKVAEMRTVSSWDPTTNSSRTAYVTNYVTCRSCQGNPNRQERCTSCQYGRMDCSGCNGAGTVACMRCNGGRVHCSGCSGTGYTSLHYLPIIEIDVDTSMAADDTDDPTARRFWNDKEFIASEALQVRAHRQVDGLVLTTRTKLQFPYAKGLAEIDDLEAPFLATGSAYKVQDMEGIVARVMEDDVRDVEMAPPGMRDDALRRLLSSKVGRSAMATHALAVSATGETVAFSPDDFQTRVGRVLDAEARARTIMVHRRFLPIAGGAAVAAAVLSPVLNHWVSRKFPIELSVVLATGVVAWWAHRRLRREGALGTSGGGPGFMRDLLRRQRVQAVASWAYGAIGVGGIMLAVSLSRWLADRAVAG